MNCKIASLYTSPQFHLSMDCFWCQVVSGELRLKEAESARWLEKDHMQEVNWLPADLTIIGTIEEQMK